MSLIWWILGWDKPVTCGNLALSDRAKYLTWNHTEADIILSELEFPFKKITYSACLNQIQEVDLRKMQYYFNCYDQSKLGSCTAQGWIFAYVFEMGKQGEKQIDMSRLAFYNCERQLLGTVDSDSGAQIRTGADVMKKMGVCLESMCPYDITKFANPLSQECIDDMKLHMGVTVERVQKNINDLKQCLIDGYPFVFGFKVYESFMQTGPDGIVKIPNIKTEQCLGGHCVACVGFKNINGKDYFIIRNSWGCNGTPSGIDVNSTIDNGSGGVVNPNDSANTSIGWGDNGHCYMPFDFIMEKDGLFGMNKMCSDFWVLKSVKDLPDSNIPLTNQQKLSEIKKIMGTNDLNLICEQLKNLED